MCSLVPSLSFRHYKLVVNFIHDWEGQKDLGVPLKWMELK